MAKEAPKGKETAEKPAQSKADKPAEPKTVKAAKPSGKTAQAAGKAAAKKTPPAKGSKKKMARGDQYSCEVCGLVVSVDEVCGCAEAHNIICCGEEMKARK
jgi:hypothetical protein